MTEWFLGADPDMHAQSIVTIDDDLNLIRIAMIKVPSKTTGIAAVSSMADQVGSLSQDWVFGCKAAAVEAQEIVYTARSGRNPRSLLHLAYISGILACKISHRTAHFDLVMPQQWKGSVDKMIHQRRICKRMGWDYTEASGYILPDLGTLNFEGVEIYGKINPSDWKHIMDSVGLALWARDQHHARERRKKFTK